MTAVDRYLVRQIVGISAALLLVALAAILLERLLQLLSLASGSGDVIGYVSRMLVSLIPQYLGIALPAALFLGVLVTFNRMSRDNELAALASAGVGLARLFRPVLAVTLVLGALNAAAFFWLQPLARYAYRAIEHQAAAVSIAAVASDGAFVHARGVTFMAEVARGDRLGRVFVFENDPKRRVREVTTAQGGALRASDENGVTLRLVNGARMKLEGEAATQALAFSDFTWPIRIGDDGPFRARGRDEREMTLPELWRALQDGVFPRGTDAARVRGELHGRLAHALSFVLLPLLAAPLALGGGRGGQGIGIAVGLGFVVLYEQALLFGESVVSKAGGSPWLLIWGPVAMLAVLGVLLFHRAAERVAGDPASVMLRLLDRLLGRRPATFAEATA